jgi:hypothetical protein
MYDPQIGRFRTQDKFSEKFIGLSPYQYGADNPIRFIDINGDSIIIPKSLTDNFIAREAFNNFASSKQGIKFLSQFAREGQSIAGHKYKKSGKYDNRQIDISYGTEKIADMDHGGETKDFIGKNGRLTIDVLVNTYGKRRTYNEIINTTLGANPTTKQLADQYGKMIFSRTGTIFHESFIHAELTAQDFMDNGKVDYSNISSQNKIGGVGNWQHNQIYYNNIKNVWPGDAYRALIDINGNMNLNYTNKQILQNIWFYNGGKEIQ